MLDDARVSWRHATISWGGRSWVIEDHGSTNGTFVQGQRIHHMEIGPGSSVHLGNATDGPRLSLTGNAAAAAPQAQPQQQPYAAQGAQAAGWAAAGAAAAAACAGAGAGSSAAGPRTFRSSRDPVVARGRRRSTATAARPRSTSCPSAA